MSLMFYYLGLVIGVIISFVIIMLLIAPLLLLVFYLLNKYEVVRWEKKHRIKTILLSCLLIFIINSVWITSEMYRTDWALKHMESTSDLSLPYFIVESVNFPDDWNGADDFGVDKSLLFMYSPSKKDIEKMYYLCDTDDRWSREDSIITFEAFEGDVIFEVVINLSNSMVHTKFHKW